MPKTDAINRYEQLRTEFLLICEGNNGEPCGGDPSVGIFPCAFYDYENGCKLKTPEYMDQPSGLNALAAEIHQNAVDHGWWEEARSLPEIIALCHSELSEALEEHRDGKPHLYCESIGECACADCAILHERCPWSHKKPEGIAVELADCMIRILDYCGKEGIDIDAVIRIKQAYNKTRPYRHGGKKI